METLILIEISHYILEKICFGADEDDGDEKQPIGGADADEEFFSPCQWQPKCNWLISAMIFQILLGAVTVVKLTSETKCNNFTLDPSCPKYYLWLIQLGGSLIGAMILLKFVFCSKFSQNRKYLEYKHLHSAKIMYVVLMIIEFIFAYFVNPFYFIVLIIDLSLYPILMFAALYFISFFRFYCKRIHSQQDNWAAKGSQCCVILLFVFYIIEWGLFVVFTFYEDLETVEDSVKDEDDDNKEVIEHVAFLQVITENAVAMEWFHIILRIIPFLKQKLTIAKSCCV